MSRVAVRRRCRPPGNSADTSLVVSLYVCNAIAIWSISVLIRVLLRRLQRPDPRRRDQRRQDADDRDHDEEFDEGESRAIRSDSSALFDWFRFHVATPL